MNGMTTPFQVAPYTIRELARRECSIRISVLGYWSTDVIMIYVRRGYSKAPEWKVEIGHSSGGRDLKEVQKDSDAEYNFALGLMEACRVAKELEAAADELEAEYQAYREELRKEEEARRAAEQAKVDADQPIGSNAELIISQLQLDAKKAPGVEKVLKFYKRGTDQVMTVRAIQRGRTSFRLNGLASSRNELIEYVANLSNRQVA